MKNLLIHIFIILFILSHPGCGKKNDYGSTINDSIREHQQNPQSPEILKNLISQLIRRSFFDEAALYLVEFKQICEKKVDNYLYIGESYENTHDFLKAKLHYESSYFEIDKDLSTYCLARLHYRYGDLEKSLSYLNQKNIKNSIIRINYRLLKAKIHQIQKYDSKAIELYEKILLIDSSNVSALLECGNIYFRKANFDEAKKYYQRIISFEPQNYRTHFRMGLLHYFKNDIPKAQKYLANAATIDPSIGHLINLLDVKKFYDTHSYVSAALVKTDEQYWWYDSKLNKLKCFCVVKSIGLQKAEGVKIYIKSIGDKFATLAQIVERSKPQNLLPGQIYSFNREFQTEMPKELKIDIKWKTGRSQIAYE